MKVEKFFGAWFAFCALMSMLSLGVTGYLIYLGIQVANKYLNG
jgi:preprotein translocase subunit Sss1